MRGHCWPVYYRGGLGMSAAQMTDDENTITEPMDFRRIMAAWNACEGISTEALEAGVVADLLDALKIAMDYMSFHNGEYDCQDQLDLINAAIAKATGETK